MVPLKRLRGEIRQTYNVDTENAKRKAKKRKSVSWKDEQDGGTSSTDRNLEVVATNKRKSLPTLRRDNTFTVFNSKNIKNLPDASEPIKAPFQRPPLLRSRTYTVLKEFEASDRQDVTKSDGDQEDPAERICNKTFIIRRAMPDIDEVEEEREELSAENFIETDEKKCEPFIQDIPKRQDGSDSPLLKFKSGHKVAIGLLLEAILSPSFRNTPGAAVGGPGENVSIQGYSKKPFNVQCQTTVDHSSDAALKLQQTLQLNTNQFDNKLATAKENDETIAQLKEQLEGLRRYVDAHALHDYEMHGSVSIVIFYIIIELAFYFHVFLLQPSKDLQTQRLRLIVNQRASLSEMIFKEIAYLEAQECCGVCKGPLHRIKPELKEYFEGKPVPGEQRTQRGKGMNSLLFPKKKSF